MQTKFWELREYYSSREKWIKVGASMISSKPVVSKQWTQLEYNKHTHTHHNSSNLKDRLRIMEYRHTNRAIELADVLFR